MNAMGWLKNTSLANEKPWVICTGVGLAFSFVIPAIGFSYFNTQLDWSTFVFLLSHLGFRDLS